MARDKLSWNNVSGNAGAGTSAMVSGSQMLAGALKSLRAPLDRANDIDKMNAESQKSANTGAYKDAILRGEAPELEGMYDSGTVADTKYAYLKDERAHAMAQERLAMARSIGRVFGLTRERIRQLEDSAIKVLKHPRTGQALREYTYEGGGFSV